MKNTTKKTTGKIKRTVASMFAAAPLLCMLNHTKNEIPCPSFISGRVSAVLSIV